jgi:hypothetical protein
MRVAQANAKARQANFESRCMRLSSAIKTVKQVEKQSPLVFRSLPAGDRWLGSWENDAIEEFRTTALLTERKQHPIP